MNETGEKFEDIAARLNLRVSRCKVCGGMPVLKSAYDDLSRAVWVECGCGLKFHPSSRRLDGIVEEWNNLNRTDEYVPKDKPMYVGMAERCSTCLQRGICTEAKGHYCLDEWACCEWIEEKKR